MRNQTRSIRIVARGGVSLIEVAFSLGIILIGLVGLISVFPVAGRQARDAVGLNNGTALATAAMAQFEARNYLQPGRWVLKPDFSFPGSTSPPIPVVNEGITSYLNSIQHINFGMTTAAVCIDPLMVAHRPGYLAPQYSTFTPLGSNGYRRLFFPYFKSNYNPLVNPSLPVTTGNQWPAMPRLTRVTVNRGSDLGAGQFITAGEAEWLTESGDELNMVQPEDKSLVAAVASDNVTGNGVGYGKVQTEGTYSWIATVNDLPGTRYSTVSIAVIQNRDRTFFTYPNDGTNASEPDENATDERLGYVTFAGGFVGGAGGTVEVQMSAFVDPRVFPGQWVMLSRNTPTGPIHRWYRINGVIGEPERVTVADPVHGASLQHDVWQLRLMLDGPDWSFGFFTPGFADSGSAANVADNTQITFIRNVVSVTERTIRRPQ